MPSSSPTKQHHGTRSAATAISLALLLFAATSGCRKGEVAPGGAGEARKPPPVEAVRARSGTLPLEEVLSGVLRARNQVAIRSEIEATIEEVLVRSGDPVVRGQPLIRLEAGELQERVRQAEASLRLAEGSAAEERARVAEIEAQVTRTRQLIARRLVSELELETLEAQLAAARARADQAAARVDEAAATLDERRTELAKAVIRAPIAGRVGQRQAEPGMLADPSRTLFLIGDFEELIVEVPLTESMLSYVEEGTPVQIITRVSARTGSEGPIRAAISRISPFLEAGSFSTLGEIDIRNAEGRLRPGMFVTVRVLYGESETATLVPSTVLYEDPRTGLPGVFRVTETSGLDEPGASQPPGGPLPQETRAVVFVPVEVLAEGRGLAGIRGVQPGEWVVVVGQHLLSERLVAESDAGEVAASVSARVRPTTWERVMGLQSLQREDMLRGFLERQRVIARAFGAEIPDDPNAVDNLLAGGAAPDGSPLAD